MRTIRLLAAALPAALVASLLFTGVAFAHAEREVTFPTYPGHVPKYKTKGPYLVVCKKDTPKRIAKLPRADREYNEDLFAECKREGFHNIQAAIDAVKKKGTRILVQPGVYHEKPSLKAPTAECEEFQPRANDDNDTNDVMTYEEQSACPNAQNLIAIFPDGDDPGNDCDGRLCNLQIEGTGAKRGDVVIDGRFKKLNVIRADRADGIYFRNFIVQNGAFNSLYILETNGYVIDRVLARWNDEYGFLTFGSDYGLYKRCGATGNGDGGLYPGGQPPHHGARYSSEISHCKSWHNALGYSGTAGNSVWVHHSKFWDNSTGIVMDSFVPDHPGMPQNSSHFEHNKIYSNNANFYHYHDDGTCSKPSEERGYEDGVVCPTFPVPVGTGILTAGGNANQFSNNYFWDNWRYGTMLHWVPGTFRGENGADAQTDTSHFNRYVGNHMSVTPDGNVEPNGTDFWWDEQGAGNCWEDNTSGTGDVSSDPSNLPDCDVTPTYSPGDSIKQAFLVPCATWSPENNHPPGCDWMETPPEPSDPDDGDSAAAAPPFLNLLLLAAAL